MKAMILAAGFGTRMGSITKLVPKPLIKINDKTLLEENIEKLASIGVKEIIINVSWLADKVIKRVGDGKSFGIKNFMVKGRSTFRYRRGNIQRFAAIGRGTFLCRKCRCLGSCGRI